MFGLVIRRGNFHCGLFAAFVLGCLMWPAAGFAYTAEEQQACTPDAFRLCGSEIPDISRVAACMARQQSQLSPACRVYFHSDSPVATARPISLRAHLRKLRRYRRYAE